MLEFSFRPVAPLDFAFCWPIYRDAMQPLIAELTQWNETSQRRGIEEALADDDASILVCEGADAGWLHVISISRRRRATTGWAQNSCAGWANGPGARRRTSLWRC